MSSAQPGCQVVADTSLSGFETAILLLIVAGVYVVTARIQSADATRSGKAWLHDAEGLRTCTDRPSYYIPKG